MEECSAEIGVGEEEFQSIILPYRTIPFGDGIIDFLNGRFHHFCGKIEVFGFIYHSHKSLLFRQSPHIFCSSEISDDVGVFPVLFIQFPVNFDGRSFFVGTQFPVVFHIVLSLKFPGVFETLCIILNMFQCSGIGIFCRFFQCGGKVLIQFLLHKGFIQASAKRGTESVTETSGSTGGCFPQQFMEFSHTAFPAFAVVKRVHLFPLFIIVGIDVPCVDGMKIHGLPHSSPLMYAGRSIAFGISAVRRGNGDKVSGKAHFFIEFEEIDIIGTYGLQIGSGSGNFFSADNVDTLFLPAFIKVQEFGVEEAVGIVDFVTVTDTVET